MSRLGFYIQYALRNLWRSRRWSTFALLSVAAGVATVVALRSLGLAIADSLTDNLQASNHGDITVEIGGEGFLSFQDPEDADGFSADQVERATQWAAQRGGKIATATVTAGVQVTALNFQTVGRPQFVTSYFIDPQTYPPTQDIVASDPADVPLGELFQGGNEVVISDNLASSQNIKVGDTVRVSGTTEEYIVRGIVPANTEAGLRNLFAAFFGFAYFDEAIKDKLPVQDTPNRIHILLPDGSSLDEIESQASSLRTQLSGFYSMTTTSELLEENQSIADVLGSFIVVLGLGALLLGGIGIINTMLVLMRRRTDEIAALKTFGLKGGQISLLFMVETLVLGAAGSILGVVLGVLLSAFANAYGQTLIQQPLVWRVYPEAVLFGIILGMVISVVFGLIPVIIAVKVRPATILRPNETVVPRLGCLQSLLMIVLVVVSIGLIAGQMLRPAFVVVADASSRMTASPFTVGIISVAVTLLILAILVGLLWILVWVIGKLPSFGFIDLRLALRNLTTSRIRTATTLLALATGMFALSSIAFFGAGVRQIVQFALTDQLGGNVLIFPILPAAVANPVIDTRLSSLEGVEYRIRWQNLFGDLRKVDGTEIESIEIEMPFDMPTREDGAAFDPDTVRVFTNTSMTIVARDSTNPNPKARTMAAGRDLTPEDRGKRVAVLQSSSRFTEYGITLGSVITVEINDQLYDFEIVGLLPAVGSSGVGIANLTSGNLEIPPASVIASSPFQLTVAQVKAENLNEVLLSLNALPLVYSLDIAFFDSIISRFINQMSAIPILVGILSLGAAAVIMANTVALATLERRRQIGILKAVGLKGGRVLRVMLVENTLISLLGSLLGIGLSAVGVA
ncbi:MAG: ABC transporter permease, partial [Anaerolineae bacterium]|nr:ABC transporter permease [Anaerolineae bacterium]